VVVIVLLLLQHEAARLVRTVAYSGSETAGQYRSSHLLYLPPSW
jgi:hypothetical protein